MLQEDAVVATGKSVIVHHKTMTNKPRRHFQLRLVGGDTHQTEFFANFVSRVPPGEGSASIFIPSPPDPLPPPLSHHNLKTTGKRICTQTRRLPQSWRGQAACEL